MYDVITIGGATRDFTFYFNPETEKAMRGKYVCFLSGVKINIDKLFFTSGGGACNVAVGLHNFGLKVLPILMVGVDTSGRAIIDDLKKKKIETKFIQIDKKLHSGLSAIINPTGNDRTILTYRGANENLKIPNPQKLSNAKWIYLAALSGKNWEQTLKQVFSIRAKNKKIKIAWNPGLLQLKAVKNELSSYLLKTEILILNKTEASILTGENEEDIPVLLKSLRQFGPKIVAITCGGDGAYVMGDDKVLYEPSRSEKVVDTSGAGDAFSSGFLAAYILYNNLEKALKLGIINSAANLRVVGAQEGLLTKKDITKLRFF